MSAKRLSDETGVSATQLYVWLNAARKAATMTQRKPPLSAEKQPGGVAKERSAEEKLRLLVAAAGLEDEQLGAFLRQEGLHGETLRAWQEAAALGLSGRAVAPASAPLTLNQRRRLDAAEKEVKELKRELRRKEKALAEAAALLVLEKKLQALGWDERHQHQGEDEDDAPGEEREE